VKYWLPVLILSLCWSVLFICLGMVTGWLTVSMPVPWMVAPIAFVYRHLRLSIIPFSCLLLVYIFLIRRMRRYIKWDNDVYAADLLYYDRLLNITISTFFGVGVIWTAIGMETALVHALSSVGSGQKAESLTAWDLLDRLVNGGLLLALSTTVFGGFCGYLLRLGKIVCIGRDWDRLMLRETTES